MDKRRKIFFIDNIKIHLDQVLKLGEFMEIEAIDETGEKGRDYLYNQCLELMEHFSIGKEDLVDCSYSDLLKE